VFEFLARGQASAVRRRSVLPLTTSLTIHAAGVMLLLALTFSDGIIELSPPRAGAMILLSPPPAIHAANPAFIRAPHAAQRTDRARPRLFRAPVIRSLTTPLRESAPISLMQIPLPEVPRPLLPAMEVAHLAAAPPPLPRPPLRTDNLAPSGPRAAVPAASAKVVSRSSGFEQIAIEIPPRPRAPPLLGGEFEDATMLPASQPRRTDTLPVLPVTRSVEILSKPLPAYTEEARRQRVEGEVLLEVMFAASGQVRVLGTVRGLGHGLDESAIAAAEAISFRPAERAGIAADSTAIVHIVFQLAF
jgi:TonB family protein